MSISIGSGSRAAAISAPSYAQDSAGRAVLFPSGSPNSVRNRNRLPGRPTLMRRGLFAPVLCALLTAGACAPGPSETAVPDGWVKVADSPLGPREQALGLWT